ncbi:hypothetical protein DPMN_064747 [Dreissena polymorpha]|uniref:Uncharacterized protein n=1 Tax=Dreissena polymorpha TaxID=45954 RepID=A0A9D4CE03_DREPO|nr:hypothetical protein DPMN_064747 [Dreissena polymorpha]
MGCQLKNAPSPDIIGTNLLTRKMPRLLGGHVFQPTGTIFKVIQDIIGMNLLTKINAPPFGSHVFQANVTIFELILHIIETNLLTKFHEDWTINVASRYTTHNRQMAIKKAHHEHVVLR